MEQNGDVIQIPRTDWLLLNNRIKTYQFSQQQVTALDHIRLGFVRGTEKRPQVYEVRLKPSRNGGGSFLIVVKGYNGREYTVAYHAGLGLFPSMVELGNRIRNGSLKFKTDQWPPENRPELYRAD